MSNRYSDETDRPDRPSKRAREDSLPTVDEEAIRERLSQKLGVTRAQDESTTQTPGEPEKEVSEESGGIEEERGSDRDNAEENSQAEQDEETPARPFIKITPAREQVTPQQIVKGLFGFYRAGSGQRLPFQLDQRISFLTSQSTFEFLIHKPRETQRFDFYFGVHPYDARSFTNLASNIAAMYPETFRFEVVTFAPGDVFSDTQSPYREFDAEVADLDSAIEKLPDVTHRGSIGVNDASQPTAADETLPAIARWAGVETRNNDWMTLLSRFTEVSVTNEETYRSPLSVLLEEATATDEPFLYQAIFSPRRDWTKEAEYHKRNLKMGYTGTLGAFKKEFARTLFGTSDEERQQNHRPDTPEQVGGTINGGSADDSTQHGRMGQIDLKQPAVTFDVSLRAAGEPAVVSNLVGAFTSLSGPYYGIEGEFLEADAKEFARLCEAELTPSGVTGRFKKTQPIIVASPDELANFVTVPSTRALPKASRGASGGVPDARSPLTATDEVLLGKFDSGMCIGSAETASDNRENIPISLTAEQLTHHILRASTTGGGKSTAIINDVLSAHAHLDGPVFVFDKKGGAMFEEYQRSHFSQFGNLDDVVHLPIPGPNGELPAFPFFDIRPQLAAGLARETAVQEKVDRYVELLSYVIGAEQNTQAFVAQEILANLIIALFDPIFGADAFAISDLLAAANLMQTEREIPDVSDPELHTTLTRHFEADDYRFQTSIDAVLNRITKLRERDFIWRMMNFVPEWDAERQAYASDQMLFNLDEILDSKKVVLIDTGELRPQSSNLFTVLFLDYIWSWVRLRKRWNDSIPTPRDGYVINLIVDEAAPIMHASLVRDEMIPDAREFALGFELIVHFPEQVKRDALDTRAYKEILRNINTKLIGKLALDDELAVTLFHEDLDIEALTNRITSLPRGEWLAQLPDTGFMTDTPELVTLKPLGIPDGHSEGDTPVEHATPGSDGRMTFGDASAHQWSRTRFSYCLIPGVNSPPDAAQRVATHTATDTESPTPGDSEESPTQQNEEDAEEESTPESKVSQALRNEFGTQVGLDHDSTDATHSSSLQTPPAGSPEKADSEKPDSDSDTSEGETATNSSDSPGNNETSDLTTDERAFLQNIVKALNGDLDDYDLLDSMTVVRNLSGSDIDEQRLVEAEYIEIHRIQGQKYYWVTKKGQQAVNRKFYSGRDQGDFNEKVRHKVFTAYFARYLEQNKGLRVETYYEPMGGGMVFDVAGFAAGQDGKEKLVVIGEVLTHVNPKWAVKHFDDFADFDQVRKFWVVQNYEVAHELVRALKDAGRIDHVPYKSVQNYTDITREAFGSTDGWFVIGATNIMELVKNYTPNSADT